MSGYEQHQPDQARPDGSRAQTVGTVIGAGVVLTATFAIATGVGSSQESPTKNPYYDQPAPVDLPTTTPTPLIDVRPQIAPKKSRTTASDLTCVNALGKAGVTMEEAGCQVLDPYAADGSETGTSRFDLPWQPGGGCGGRIVGYVGMANGEMQFYTGGMPQRFQDGIAWAMGDPVVQRLAHHAEGGVIFTLTNPRNAAAYYTAARKSGEQDMVQVCLSIGEDGSYPTHSALAATLRHEFGHAFHDDLRKAAASNPETAALLQEYEQATLDELRVVAEATRASMQDRAIEVLTNLYGKHSPESPKAQIIKYVIDAFARPNGLDDLIADVNEAGEPQLVNIHSLFNDEPVDMFALAARKLGIPYSYGSDYPRQGAVNQIVMFVGDGLKELSEDFLRSVEASYGYLDEGTVASDFARGGHPQKNSTEWFASVFASIPADPASVESAIRALPPAQRRLAVRKLELIQELVKWSEPGLEQEIGLSGVLERARNALTYDIGTLSVGGFGGGYATVAVYKNGYWTVSAEWAMAHLSPEDPAGLPASGVTA